MARELYNVLLANAMVYVLPLLLGVFWVWCAWFVFPKSKRLIAPLLIVVGLAFALTSFLAVGSFVQARNVAAGKLCIDNLRQINGAKQTWALENHKGTNDVVTWENIRQYTLYKFQCPKGGTYILGKVGEKPRCSFDKMHVLPDDTWYDQAIPNK